MKICPVCESSEIGLHMAGLDGKYECKKCGYVGPIILEKFKKDKMNT